MKNNDKRPFSKDILIINDIEAECNRIIAGIRENISASAEPDGWSDRDFRRN